MRPPLKVLVWWRRPGNRRISTCRCRKVGSQGTDRRDTADCRIGKRLDSPPRKQFPYIAIEINPSFGAGGWKVSKQNRHSEQGNFTQGYCITAMFHCQVWTADGWWRFLCTSAVSSKEEEHTQGLHLLSPKC
jgi:hypothetical protein